MSSADKLNANSLDTDQAQSFRRAWSASELFDTLMDIFEKVDLKKLADDKKSWKIT